MILVNEAYEHGDENAFPSDLLPSAVQVMKSTEGLVGAASKLAQQATDQVIITYLNEFEILSSKTYYFCLFYIIKNSFFSYLIVKYGTTTSCGSVWNYTYK